MKDPTVLLLVERAADAIVDVLRQLEGDGHKNTQQYQDLGRIYGLLLDKGIEIGNTLYQGGGE